jgi:hypothetical protein
MLISACSGDLQPQLWLADPDADYLSLRPWLRPAITAALAALDAADPDSMS